MKAVSFGQIHRSAAKQDEVEAVGPSRAILGVERQEFRHALGGIKPTVVKGVRPVDAGVDHKPGSVGLRVLIHAGANDPTAFVGNVEALAGELVLLGREKRQKSGTGKKLVNAEP